MWIIEPGATDQTIYVRLRDSTTGLAKTGLAYNSAGASAYYTRERGTATAITLATLASASAGHSDGGFIEVDGTNAKGLYRLDLPDAAIAAGSPYVIISIEFDGVIEESTLIQLSPKVDLADGAITAAKIATDAFTAAKIAADAVSEIQNGLATSAKLLAYVQLLARSDGAIATDRATELGEINANEGSGAGDFDNTVDSQEGHADVATEARLAELDAANIPADIDTLLARLTAARAGYLDNLNVGGNVASSAEVTSIQNNTRVVRVVPTIIEVPDTGTQTYRIELLIYDEVGNMEAPDSAPTLTLVNQAGTDRSSRLDSTTMTLVATGHYRVIYTATAGDALEQLVWTFSVVEGSNTRSYGNTSLIVDTTAVDFTSTDRTKLDDIHNKLPTNFIMGSSDQDDHDTDIDTLVSRIPDTLSLANILTQAATALTNIHLDHLLATDYDPASKPGVATALLNELIENDGGVSRFTANALEQAPATTITTQDIRDAMKLAPSAGSPAAGSIDEHLDSIISTLAGGLTLTSAERTAIANALLDLANAIETGVTPRGALRVILAAVAGKASGLSTTTARYQNANVGSKDRITATVDQYGNRSAVTLDMS